MRVRDTELDRGWPARRPAALQEHYVEQGWWTAETLGGYVLAPIVHIYGRKEVRFKIRKVDLRGQLRAGDLSPTLIES